MTRWWCSTVIAEGVWLVSHQTCETEAEARSLHAQVYRKRFPEMDPSMAVVKVAGVSTLGWPTPASADAPGEIGGVPA